MGMERLASLIGEKPEEKVSCFVVSNNPLEAIRLTTEVRNLSLSCEFDLSNKKFVKQIEKASKVADKALILGEDEIEKGLVTVKDLASGKQNSIQREELKENLLNS